jgi:hypothetical protein
MLQFTDSLARPFLFGAVLRYVRHRQANFDFRLPYVWGRYLQERLTRCYPFSIREAF